MTQEEIVAFMDQFDVKGWRPVLYDVDPEDKSERPACSELEAGHDPHADDVVRREQWFISGDQYLLAYRNAEGRFVDLQLGEQPCTRVTCMDDVLIEVRRHLASGTKRDDVHPVLLALLGAESAR